MNTAHDYDFHRCCGIQGSVPGVGARGSSESLSYHTQHTTTPSKGDAIRASGASTRGLLCAARLLSWWHSGVGARSRRQGVFRFVRFHNQHRHQAKDVCVLLSHRREDCCTYSYGAPLSSSWHLGVGAWSRHQRVFCFVWFPLTIQNDTKQTGNFANKHIHIIYIYIT